MNIKKLLITGGHLSPVLSLIDQLKLNPNWEISVLGRKFGNESSSEASLESKVIPDMGIKFYPINPARLQRKITWAGIKSLLKFPQGVISSYLIISKINPDIILSFGGYVGFYAALVGYFKNIPVVIHEQTTVPGLANRLTARLAKKIAISWEGTNFAQPQKTVLIGNLIRKEIINPDKSKLREFELNSKLPTIFFMGGHQGSHILNQSVIPKLNEYLKIANVIFSTGSIDSYGDFELATKTVDNFDYPGKIHIAKFVTGNALHLTDLVVGRSGANTVTEVAFLGKPAIFIPLPWSAGEEQLKNAMLLNEKGSQILNQRDLNPDSLLTRIKEALKNLPLLTQKANLAKKLVDVRSTEKLINLLNTVSK